MKYKVKKDHEIVEFILNEIQNTTYIDSSGRLIGLKDKAKIALSNINIENHNLCSTDIYGFHFNANNSGSLCINCGYYSDPIVDSPSLRVESLSVGDKIKGYEQYRYSCNTTIKMSNFLSRHPQYSNIKDWADEVVEPRTKCEYASHNSDQRRVSIRMPDGTSKCFPFPDGESDRSILTWVKPMTEALTIDYYRNIALDEVLNIKRKQVTWIEGIWFNYNYKDGDVEVYSMVDTNKQMSIKNLVKLNLINVDLINNAMIVGEIEKSLFDRYDREMRIKSIKIVC